MTLSMNLWKVRGDGLYGVNKLELNYEARLESWIAKDPSILGSELIPIGKQVITELGGRIDLLCIDRQGDLTVLELKRHKTSREVVAQVLEYASWVKKLTYEDVNSIALEYRKKDLSAILSEHFEEIPENINSSHSMLIVTSVLDEASESIIQYLADEYGVNINVAFFTFFKDGEDEFLGRAWLADPEKVQEKSETRKKGIWSGYWFVNAGESEHRNWEDDVRYGCIGAGHGSRYRRALQRLHVGDKIFAYISGYGYVGYGEVTQEATMVKEFIPENETKSLLQLPLKAPKASENSDDPELSEWVVGVKWIKLFGKDNPKSFKGVFANQNVVCKLRDETTVAFLAKEFGLGNS
jgi:hypothetical protein